MTLYDFPISDEMKALGFSRVYKKDKNLVIYNSPALITSRYFTGDLQSTLHQLERALVQYDKRNNNHFGNEKIERFLKWFGELDIKTDEAQEDAGKEVQRIETLHKQRVLDQINELRAVYAGISSDDWRAGLMSRYEKLHQTVQNNMYIDNQVIHFIYSKQFENSSTEKMVDHTYNLTRKYNLNNGNNLYL